MYGPAFCWNKSGYPRQRQTALDISSKGDSTTTLGNSLQCRLVLTVKNFFLTSRWNLPWVTCASFPLSCASLYLHLLYKPSLKHLKSVTRLPSACSSLGWKKSNSFGLSFFMHKVLQPPKCFGGPLLDPLQFPNVSLELGEQRWDTAFPVRPKNKSRGRNRIP